MPFEDERSNLLGHLGIVSDEAIKRRLQSLDLEPQIDAKGAIASVDQVSLDDLSDSPEDLPDRAIAIDGSRAEPQIEQDKFTAHVGFVEVSAVEVDMGELRSYRGKPTVDPGLIHDAANISDTRIVLPGQNAHFHGIPPKPRGWRLMLFKAFQEKSVRGVGLLEIYQVLLKNYADKIAARGDSDQDPPLDADGKIILRNCPNPSCDKSNIRVPSMSQDRCPSCSMDIYPTDRLRIHERVGNYRSNLTAINIVMEVLVHLILAAALEGVRRDSDEDLSDFVFMKDGPLAQFDTAAWVARAMLAYIEELREKVEQMPPIIGLHKSGEFVTFADRLRDGAPEQDDLPEQTVIPLESGEIYDYVKSRDRDGVFGQKSYYGKNFVYKSESGYMFPITIPRQMPSFDELESNPSAYPILRDSLLALDDAELALYNDSVIPIHMAHDEATIPEKLGSKVLRELVEAEVLNADRVYGR